MRLKLGARFCLWLIPVSGVRATASPPVLRERGNMPKDDPETTALKKELNDLIAKVKVPATFTCTTQYSRNKSNGF